MGFVVMGCAVAMAYLVGFVATWLLFVMREKGSDTPEFVGLMAFVFAVIWPVSLSFFLSAYLVEKIAGE